MPVTEYTARFWCDVLFHGKEEQICRMTDWFGPLPDGPLKEAIVEMHASPEQLTIHAVHPFAAVWDELEDLGALPQEQFLFIARFLAVEAAAYVRDARDAHKALEKMLGLPVAWKFRSLSDSAQLAVQTLAADVALPSWHGFDLV